MDEFPKMLYRAGGPEPIHGGYFSTRIVHDADEHGKAAAEGWFDTTPNALQAQAEERAQAAEAAAKLAAARDDLKPTTREELEAKATELGIPFKPQTSDKKLAEAIAAKLAAAGA